MVNSVWCINIIQGARWVEFTASTVVKVDQCTEICNDGNFIYCLCGSLGQSSPQLDKKEKETCTEHGQRQGNSKSLILTSGSRDCTDI